MKSALTYHPLVTEVAADTGIARAEADRADGRLGPILSLTTFGRRSNDSNEFIELDDANVSRSSATYGLESTLEGTTGFGGRYQLRTRTQFVDAGVGDPFVALTKRHQNEVALRWTQPLLRDFGTTANAGRIEREKINGEATARRGEQQLLQLVLDVHNRYWILVLRREEARIRRVNLTSATQLRDVVARRVAAGGDAANAIVQADASIAERRQAVNVAEAAIIDAESDLLRASYLTRAGVIKAADVLIPSEKFGDVDKVLDFDRELQQALKTRPEVQRVQQEVRLAELDRRIAENGKRWRVDLYGEGGVVGIAGIPRTGFTVPDDLEGASGNFARSISNSYKSPFVELGVQISIPLDNGDAGGALKQAELRVKKQKAVDVETQITVDIRAALQRLALARKSLDVAKRALELAEEFVEGQERRYAAGGKILFDVLQAQDQRTAAEANLVLARAQHEIARAALDAARGTLLGKYR